jgi:SAM-dependent methyltransferase
MHETDRAAGNWHVRLFNKSIAKQAKLSALLKFLPPCVGKICLDLGGDNGIISYLLRQRGGTWHSADLSEQAVESIRALVHSNVHRTDGSALPFPDSSFDLAVIIDFLEHIPHDRGCIKELHRVMKPGGVLIINVPHLKKRSVVRRLRNLLGLTDEQHGHLRPGYTLQGLQALLEGLFSVEAAYTYSRFFSELIDIAISLGCAASVPEGSHGGKGVLITGNQLAKREKQFRMYSLFYPFMWLFSRLDTLIFFTRGHRLIVRSVKV